MRLLKILIIIGLILLAIPFFNATRDYIKDKSAKFRVMGETGIKAFRYKKKD